MLDLCAGELGWAYAFAKRGHICVCVDLRRPRRAVPQGCHVIEGDILDITADYVRNFDFVVASTPCEEFSVHGMKHFHPHPPYPELGMKLFNHTRSLCKASGVPYVMENVKAAEKFVGPAGAHCGPFYLWGTAIPPLLHRGISKNMSQARERGPDGKRIYAASADRMWSTKRKQVVATIPPELANCVAEYAERILEQNCAVREMSK